MPNKSLKQGDFDEDVLQTQYFRDLFPVFFAASTKGAPIAGTPALATPLLTPSLVTATNTNPFAIKLVWDSTVNSTPSSLAFQASVINAAQLIDNVLTDNITVNIQITNSGTTGASAGPTTGIYEPYTLTYANLTGSHVSDPSFAKLPSGSSVQSQSTVAVWNAQLKLWGEAVPTSSPILNSVALDAVATFGIQISQNALVGVVLHELHHALGGVPYGPQPDIFDLFRFTAPGKMLFTAGNKAPAAYFSIDGGVTKLAYFGMTSDPSDFLNGIPSGGGKTVYNTTYDAFSEFYYSNGSSYQYLSAVDLHLMDALGYHLSSLAIQDVSTFNNYTSNVANTAPVIISDSASAIQVSLDSLNTNINKIYSISATDPTTAISITGAQSVNDQSVLMLMGDYQPGLHLIVTGTSGNDTLYGVAGTNTINGLDGVNSIILNYHTTTDTIWHNSAVKSSNLEKVTGFLSTDNITLANTAGSLNGLCDLYSGNSISAGNNVSAIIKSVVGGSAFSVTSSAYILDLTGKTYTSMGTLITDLAKGTFGANIPLNSHLLIEYSGTDGLHLAEITQGTGASAKHLASNSIGCDLVDLIGVTQHLTTSELTIGIA